MIKTVSFAPPRGADSRPSAKSGGAKVVPVEPLRPTNSRAASGRNPKKAPAQTSLAFEFGEGEAAIEAPTAPPIAAPAVATPAVAAKKSISAPQTARKAGVEVTVAPIAPEPAPKTAPIAKAAPVVKTVAKTEAATGVAAPTKSGEVKAKRARVPKDLAAQYGEKVVARAPVTPIEPEAAKKRLSKVERQARRDLIRPSEDLIARLARASQISAQKPKAEPRGKGWKFQCGRCGTTSYFETPGGLCVCGTIAVKE